MAKSKGIPDDAERVTMVWSKDLKNRVRARAGHRGMTEFVTKAVEDALGVVPKNEHPFVPDSVTALSVEEAQEAPVTKANKPVTAVTHVTEDVEPAPSVRSEPLEVHVREVWQEPDHPATGTPTHLASQEETPEDLPHDTKGRDDLFARLMAKTKNGEDFESMKSVLKPASEIPKPEPRAANDVCSECGEVLVDGECWTCA